MGTDRTETTTADDAALAHAEAWILANIPASERAGFAAAFDDAAGTWSTETILSAPDRAARARVVCGDRCATQRAGVGLSNC